MCMIYKNNVDHSRNTSVSSQLDLSWPFIVLDLAYK